jgi:hypothetical protein
MHCDAMTRKTIRTGSPAYRPVVCSRCAKLPMRPPANAEERLMCAIYGVDTPFLLPPTTTP